MLVFKTVFKTAIFPKNFDGDPTKIAKMSRKLMKNQSVAAQEVRRRGARCAIVSVVAPAPFVAGAPTSTTRTNMRAPHRLTTSHCLRSMPCRSGRCARSLHRARNALCSVSCSYVTTIPAQRAAACAAALIFLVITEFMKLNSSVPFVNGSGPRREKKKVAGIGCFH